MPPAIVAATLIERNAPTKFRTAAMVTATRGRRALVAMVVAMALAVSWKPLVKSNPTAVITTMTRSAVVPDTLRGVTVAQGALRIVHHFFTALTPPLSRRARGW